MPEKKRAVNRKAEQSENTEIICPIRSINEAIHCRREDCAWYVDKASRCSVWLISYYMFRMSRGGEEQ